MAVRDLRVWNSCGLAVEGGIRRRDDEFPGQKKTSGRFLFFEHVNKEWKIYKPYQSDLFLFRRLQQRIDFFEEPPDLFSQTEYPP